MRTLKVFILTAGTLAILAVGLTGALLYGDLSTGLPPVEQLADYQPPMSTQILAADGSVIGEFFLEKRYVVPIDRIPRIVRDAFIAAEDDQFYEHKGIDPTGIARAFFNNLAAGGKVQGGSTITQQVVKQLLLSPRKSYERKLKELILALRLEHQLPKDKILYLYLNHIYLGSGAYGVAAAAYEYFGKPVDQLSLAEAALLAGLTQAPSKYSPFRHWPRAKARQGYVLERMAAVGFITGAEAVLAAREPLSLAPRRGSFVAAPYYVEHVRRILEQRYGESALYQLGLRVYTPVDLKLQEYAEKALYDGLRELEQRQHYGVVYKQLPPSGVAPFLAAQEKALGGRPLQPKRTYEAVVTRAGKSQVTVRIGSASASLSPIPRGTIRPGDVLRVRLKGEPEVDESSDNPVYEVEIDTDLMVQGAAVVMDPHTGDVRAMVGGTNFNGSQFNRATQALRQPGSSFKPLVYAAALDEKFTPATIIVDAPISFPDNRRVWSPQNYENRFYGPTTIRDALTFSRNVPTVKVAQRIGVRNLVTFLKSLGIRSPLAPNLSLALGAAEVTPLELVSAYTAFANDGIRAEPRFILKITDSQGNPIDEMAPTQAPVLSPETAYIVTSILQDVITRGTGRRASNIGRPAAGKTGTTNDMNDAWFVGYTPQLLAGFWAGFDEKKTLGKGETGGRAVAPIWLEFMRHALENEPILDFAVPSGISFVPIDPHSGHRTSPGAPGAILECFRRGTEPAAIEATNLTGDTEDTADTRVVPVEVSHDGMPADAPSEPRENNADAGF